MTRFALVCPPFWSHVRAFEALGEALVERGHEAVLVLNHGGAALSRSRLVSAHEIAGDRGEAGRHARAGRQGLLRTVREAGRRTDALCREAPTLLHRLGIEALLADQMEPAGGLLARRLRLPFLSVASALPVDPDPSIPPPFLDWPFDPSPEGLKRNRGGACVAGLVLRPQRRVIRRWSERFALAPPLATLEDCLSPLGTISQTPREFDFPYAGRRRILGVGPLRAPGEGEEPLPFTRDPGRPLVFASLGTLQGHRLGLFRAIAEGCRRLDLDLAVAHCGRLSAEEAATIDARIVTDFLPQRAMLRAASACVTHAGLNTVLDAMEAGVPALAIPIAYDQPGVAARLVHHGAGLKLPRCRLSPDAVEAALERLLTEPRHAENARRMGAAIGRAGGAPRAALAIEDWIAEAPCARRPARKAEPA